MHKIVVYRQKRGLGYDDAAGIVTAAARAALKAERINDDCVVNVMLTDNEGIHAINLEQRGVDSATDVLSFPLNELRPGEFDPEKCEFDYDCGKIALGDMVISLQRCQTQAEEYGHSFRREVSYLTVHSILHLLGYDHMDEGEQKKLMRSHEDAAMALLDL